MQQDMQPKQEVQHQGLQEQLQQQGVDYKMTYIINAQSQKYTFPAGSIDSIKTTISSGVETNDSSTTGPAFVQGSQMDGAKKTITISGRLIDNPSASVITTTSGTPPNIRSKEVQKLWLEALPNGMQIAPLEFYSYLNQKSIETGVSTTTFVDSVSGANVEIQGSFVTTKVYIDSFTYDEEEGNVESIFFTLTLTVAGI
jgi:hypothetical protein